MDKDIRWYNRPGFGYEVILFAQQGIDRQHYEGKYLGIHPTLSTVFEYRYRSDGSRYSYPARDEAEARKLAVEYAIQAIADHWDRSAGTGNSTRMDARIYPFGGMIREMRLVRRR